MRLDLRPVPQELVPESTQRASVQESPVPEPRRSDQAVRERRQREPVVLMVLEEPG